ncbi:acetyltransferase (GNAT) family protein [Kribbella voronezhensis]|uniref:Acetyltransferase (GNAT) family protein n=1 Tax=Kribbella voronezhensis TaxID=2512212 RepID=A0A4R7TDJ1_9ACTN|nr:GNAT family N-acetyltransferase [Kribbella voronezhensis]TDU90211.1 acetyltransferase (GNAT) family protein [Kribbella voronezhensis]
MTITVKRSEDQEGWIASRDGAVIGELHPWPAPDRKLRLFFGDTEPAAYEPLIDKVTGPCLTTVDEADRPTVDALRALGFTPVRREVRLEIPVTRASFDVPAGYRLISAADTGVQDLMALDDALRTDVPGAEGWESDEASFREQTYDSPYFDPATYLVAVDPENTYAGLVRIWNGPRPLPRLGLIGVLRNHRRRGLARALVSAALTVLADRGASLVTAEADETNTASLTLLASFGAVQVGADLELAR